MKLTTHPTCHTRWITSALMLAMALPVSAQHAHMNDAHYEPFRSRIAPLDRHMFPRVCLETKSLPATAEAISKYDAITANPAQMSGALVKAQRINTDLLVWRKYNAGGYQSYSSSNPCQDALGVPFGSAAASTENCGFFAGHWAYYAGTTTNQSMTASSMSVNVADGTRVTPGRYVVIYDAPAGSFRNAEHARVQSVNGNSVTLAQRGFKSTPRAHPAGSIVAEHPAAAASRGVTNPLHWRYNMSSTCPRDGKGRQLSEVMADWLSANLAKNGRGQTVDVRIDAVIFDTDAWSVAWEDRLDVNNDLVPDGGWNQTTGVNYWGDGSERFYELVRDRLPDLMLLGGDRHVRGFESLNGTQMEGWPVSGSYFSSTPEYEEVGALLANSVLHLREGPPHHASIIQNFSKTRTRLYPDGTTPRPTSNAPFRFALGLSLLDDGFFAVESNQNDRDPWWDEFAVDVGQSSPTYGHAIAFNPVNESVTRLHTDWLGLPIGARERVYTPSSFGVERSIIANGGLDSSGALSGWQSSNVRLAFDGADRMAGTGSMRVSTHLSYAARPPQATVQTPAVSLRSGVDYTLVFSAKADQTREVAVAAPGNSAQSFLIPNYWVRRAMTFTAGATGNGRINFQVGREDVRLWLDEVYLFEGNADIFRREFENGLVVVNATSSARTVPLGSEFLRIRGSGQDPINDGSRLTSVTIAAHDAAILVKPPQAVQGSPIPCGTPTFDSASETGVFISNDCSDRSLWTFRFSAGGQTLSYRGQITSDRRFSGMTGVGQGGADELTPAPFSSPTDGPITYVQHVSKAGVDGIDVRIPLGASLCFSPTSPAEWPVLAGPNRRSLETPVDLMTLETCEP